jgi:hypothetical protein
MDNDMKYKILLVETLFLIQSQGSAIIEFRKKSVDTSSPHAAGLRHTRRHPTQRHEPGCISHSLAPGPVSYIQFGSPEV